MAGGMVADHFRAVSAEDADPGAADAYRANQPAVVPPAELGLAMWSPLPETAPAEPEHLSISPASIAAEPEPVAAVDSAVSDADIAALLAEAESLEALEEAADPPAPVLNAPPAENTALASAPPPSSGRAMSLADIAFEATDVDADIEPALVLDAEPDLEMLTAYAPPAPQPDVTMPPTFVEPIAQAAVVEELTAGPVEAGAADETSSVEPGFQLESQSVHGLETLAAFQLSDQADIDLEDAVGQAADVDPDAQPILRFDLEPVVEPQVQVEVPAQEPEPVPALAAAVAVEPEPLAPIALVPTESVVESAVIASVQARIAEVVAIARAESEPTGPRASVVALERFLHQVRARRRTMAESVA